MLQFYTKCFVRNVQDQMVRKKHFLRTRLPCNASYGIGRPMYGIHNIEDVKVLTKLRVEFSDLRSRRFNHNFNCKSPMCSCNLKDEEDNSHYFLRCPHFHHIRINLFSNISRIIGSGISILPCDPLTNIILYGSNVYNKISNNLILIETLEYIRKSERFSVIEAFFS